MFARCTHLDDLNGIAMALYPADAKPSDLFVGHSSWFTYSSMLRIFKTYDFAFQDSATASRVVSFSSYPGVLSSLDDFYMMKDSNMAMVQTTNGIYNQTCTCTASHGSSP